MLERVDLIRAPYRALLNSGRTYAAFQTKTTAPLIEELKDHEEIIDPMAGYGTLMRLCSEMGVSTYNIELNPPLYLWEVLNKPDNAEIIVNILNELIGKVETSFTLTIAASVSGKWFPRVSYEILTDIFEIIIHETRKFIGPENSEEIALSILLPFVGRLSSCVPGNVVSHVKQGGICIYSDLFDDYKKYLLALKGKLEKIKCSASNFRHSVLFGDVRTVKLERKFTSFITSPPYPNGRDYFKMFAPENDFLLYLKAMNIITGFDVSNPLISSSTVSKYSNTLNDCNVDLVSESSKEFLEYLANYAGRKFAIYDNRVYYIPYFYNYFYQLERAFTNFCSFLSKKCEGYVVVVNNTARKRVIPVAESIIELFKWRGLNAQFDDRYSREMSHVGSINPRVKGLMARHMEYTIKIWRD